MTGTWPDAGDAPRDPAAGLVVNQRRGALLATAAILERGAAEVAAAVGPLTAALEAGAWAGPAADAWARELAQVWAGLSRAFGDAAAACTSTARAQPEWVAPDDPRAVRPPAVPGFLRDGR